MEKMNDRLEQITWTIQFLLSGYLTRKRRLMSDYQLGKVEEAIESLFEKHGLVWCFDGDTNQAKEAVRLTD